MTPELEILSNRLINALGNGLYQGLLLAGVVWFGLRIASRTNAATRYATRLLALLIVAALPIAHFFLSNPADARTSARRWISDPYLLANTKTEDQTVYQKVRLPLETASPSRDAYRSDPSKKSHERQRNLNGSAPILKSSESSSGFIRSAPPSTVSSKHRFGAMRTGRNTSNSGRSRSAKTVSEPIANVSQADPMPGSMGLNTGPLVELTLRQGFDEPGEPTYPEAEKTVPRIPILDSKTPSLYLLFKRIVATALGPIAELSRFHWQPALPQTVVLTLCGLWIGIATIRWLVLLTQYALLFRMKRRSENALGDLAVRFDELRTEMGIHRNVTLKTTSELDAPVAAGFFHPAVLLPAQMSNAATSPGLEGILRHELAHLKRGDDWTNLIQQFVLATLFFHPAVRWFSRSLTVDREIACDDHVLGAMRRPRDYALFLTEFAGRTKCHDWNVAPAAWSKTSQLKERINMILDTQRNKSTRLARTHTGALAATALLTAFLGIVSGPRLAIAQDSIDPDAASKTSEESDVIPNRNADDSSAAIPIRSVQSVSVIAPQKRTSGLPVVSEDVNVVAQIVSQPRQRIRKISPTLNKKPLELISPSVAFVNSPTDPVLALVGSDCDESDSVASRPTLGVPPSRPALALALVGQNRAARNSRVEVHSERALERRLKRLESMVESLLARELQSRNGETADDDSELDSLDQFPDSDYRSILKKKQSKRLHDDLDHIESFDEGGDQHPHAERPAHRDVEHGFDFDFDVDVDAFSELTERFQEQAARVAEQAARQTDRAMREAQRAGRIMQRHSEEAGHRELPIEIRRRILEEQRESLEHQLQDMERQLDELKGTLEELDEQAETLESEKSLKKRKSAVQPSSGHSERPEF